MSELYRVYKEYGAGPIPRPEGFDPGSLDKNTRELLDEVYEVYGQYSAWRLPNMTHEEAPWRQVFDQSAPGRVIEHDALRDYFHTQPKTGGWWAQKANLRNP